ncbi:MAG: metal ABC transporter permease [Candidatus Thiodiazotropha sp.]
MNPFELDISILGPAFAAGLLILSTHVPLGRQVLARGIIFIDLAIAQVAGVGVILAANLGWDEHGMATQLAAFIAALSGALLLWGVEKLWPDIQEALIGVLFVVSACLGILLLAHNPEGGEHLQDLLVGQILWVGYVDLMLPAVVYGVMLAVWFVFPARNHPLVFYPLFAVTVTVSVQLVGVYLVFASLILPAIATRWQPQRGGLWLGYLLGGFAYALGLLLSLWLDLPAGALIVCSLFITILPWLLLHSGQTGKTGSEQVGHRKPTGTLG